MIYLIIPKWNKITICGYKKYKLIEKQLKTNEQSDIHARRARERTGRDLLKKI